MGKSRRLRVGAALGEPDDVAAASAALLPAGASELTLDEALQLAVRMHREDRLEGAMALYTRILEAVPDHADALCLLGMAEHQIGRSEHGLKLVRRAIEHVPGFAGFQINLGNLLVEMNRLQDGLAAYARAIELGVRSADILSNMGAVYRALGQPDQARAAYDSALELDPGHVRAWNNLALLLDGLGDVEGATKAYLAAMDLGPGQGMSAAMLGRAYYRSGQLKKATEVFRQWMLRQPDDPVPAHLYAACSGLNVPDRAGDAYIEAEFDTFAASFEQVLNEGLNYRAPQLCADLLAEILPAPARSHDLLDAGCGTGLCGHLIAPWARRLVGVDLSAGMLSKARSKGVYDELVKAELTAYLQHSADGWDTIVCADTLCYFGDLSAVMLAAAQALRPGGAMVYTVEAMADDNATQATILPSGRYAHGRAHLDQVALSAGLQVLATRREVLRDEVGAPVHGWLAAVRRPA